MFESCSAYQTSPAVLFLSHCVPNPPDKGEKIRAYHLLNAILERFPVHLVCFTREASGIENARALRERCQSVYVEQLPFWSSLARASAQFALGRCLTTSFYGSPAMRRHVRTLCRTEKLGAAVAFSSAMAPYAPEHLPLYLDMVDVDSAKWFDYGRSRFPGLLYRMEARRLRRVEAECSWRARCTWLTTQQEYRLLEEVAPFANLRELPNGVDEAYFDPAIAPAAGELADRNIVLFVGAMDYYPNVDACRLFAAEILPEMRKRFPDIEFFIIGRDPHRSIRKLGQLPGVTVTGAVPDVRPYIAAARATVAPLRIARGIQNKVLESLAMGKPVLASPQVCATFGAEAPPGVVCCSTTADYVEALCRLGRRDWREEVRRGVLERFQWATLRRNVQAELESLMLPAPAAAGGR